MTKREQYQALTQFLEILFENDEERTGRGAFESYSGSSSIGSQRLGNEVDDATRYRCILSGDI